MTADSDAPVAVAGAGTRSAGYLSATLGTLIGANALGFGLGLGIAVPAGQLLGDLGRPGGLEVLIGALLGFVLGWALGGALGCLVALRVAGHTRRGRTALCTAGFLIVVLALVLVVSEPLDVRGVVAILELGLVASALLARRLTRPDAIV